MSSQDDLRRIARSLRTELEWASRTGIEVVVAKPRAAPSDSDGPEEALPLNAGRPMVEAQAAAEAAADAAPAEPPPAFEPDSVEAELPAQRHVAPDTVRVREAPKHRPWEQYLPEGGRGSTPPSDAPPPFEPDAQRADPPPFTPDAPPTSEPARPANRLPRAQSLGQVREILGDCDRCKLSRGRRNIVFGVGNPDADLMFVGEGPGADEDRQGEPFVGKAGQLLTRIIEAGMKIPRQEVYIANIVKCRPPNNRDPEPDEVEACEPFLKAQIQQVKPRVIVALGKYAAQTLLRNTTPISRMRGKWFTYEGIDLMPTFHPAYLLRNEREKRPVWEDVQAVMRRLQDGGAR